jgi:hypothetical protein
MADIDRKLDFIVEELANLKQLRQSAEDLAADLSLVGKGAMRDAVDAFGTADLCPQEVFGLLKTVMANARLFEVLVQQLQSAADFIQDARPILRDVMMMAVAGGNPNAHRAGMNKSERMRSLALPISSQIPLPCRICRITLSMPKFQPSLGLQSYTTAAPFTTTFAQGAAS